MKAIIRDSLLKMLITKRKKDGRLEGKGLLMGNTIEDKHDFKTSNK